MNQFVNDFLKLILLLLLAAIVCVLCFILCVLIDNIRKKQKNKCKYRIQSITDDVAIVEYKMLMGREKFSNHSYVSSEEDNDVYDKLSSGSKTIDSRIIKSDYRIDDIFRRTYG